MKRIFRMLFLASLLLGLAGGAARAQQPPAQAQPQKDAEGFEPVNGDMMAKGESIPAAPLVGLAYGFIFFAMLVWVASVARRQRRVEDEMDALKKKLESRA